MDQNKIDILQRALNREKQARKAAEAILEEKSRSLYETNKKLENLYSDLESEYTKTDSQLQGVFENIVDPYIIVNLVGDILRMNNAAMRLLGIPEKYPDENLAKMVHPEDVAYMVASFETFLKEGFIKDFEIRLITKYNEIKIVHVNGSVILDKGKPVAAQAIVRDITELKEKELVVELINSIGQSVLGKLDIYDIAFEITQKIADYLGTNDCVFYLCHEETEKVEQIAAYGKILNNHNKLIFSYNQGITGRVAKTGIGELIADTSLDKDYIVDDATRLSEITIPIKIGNKVIGVIDAEHKERDYFSYKHLDMLNSIASLVAMQVKSAIDLKERTRVESELRASEERLHTLMLNLDKGVLMSDEFGKVVFVNPRFCELFDIDVPPETLQGLDCLKAAENAKDQFENPESFINGIKTTLKNRELVINEEMVMKNGKTFEGGYIPIYKNGINKGDLWTYRDITIIKKYHESIETQKEKYVRIIANMNLGLLEFDNGNKIVMANQSFLNMSGYSEAELLGKNAIELLPIPSKGNKELLKKVIIQRDQGHASTFELEVKNKKGEKRFWLVSGAPNYNINGESDGGIGIHLDITEIKNLQIQKEQLLTQLEKSNDELQEYAHIVSHDLKSPLRSIYALIEWLKADNVGKLDEQSLIHFNLIESTLEKMEALITDILHYSEVGTEIDLKQEIDLNNLVDEVLSVLFKPEHITIYILNSLPTIFADKIKIHQLFQNLISNAVKFIDKPNGFVKIDFEENKTHYQFSIKDNGCGIDEKYHQKIFEIFHALQEREDSTGIGLSIVKKIVELHKGEIWLESTPGEGTTFFFTIKK